MKPQDFKRRKLKDRNIDNFVLIKVDILNFW